MGMSDWLDDDGMDYNQWPGSESLPENPLTSSSIDYDAGGLPGLSGGGDYIKQLIASLASPKKQTMGQPGSQAGDLGSILGAFSSGEKANRFMQGNFTQNYDKLMLDAQTGRNANESDALKKLQQTSYLKEGGSKFKAPTLSLNGKTYNTPDLGFGPQPVSEETKAGASALQPQLKARLMPGGSYTPQPLNDYAKPGAAENASSYGAAGLSGLGAIQDMMGGEGGQTPGSGVNSMVSGLSKGLGTAGSIAKMAGGIGGGAGFANSAAAAARAASGGSMVAGSGLPASGLSGTLGTIGKVAGPIAGAAAGTYGLIKNNSVGSDIMSGAGAGASIGSFGGPIGMGIGAGVGALVGALRGAFSVTAKEQGGRDAQGQVTQNLKQLSSPQQQAEASHAGWPDPNQALSLIVMRDALTKSGVPGPQAETQAEQYMHSIWDAEKGGADKVAQAYSPIQSMMGQNPGVGSNSPSGGRLITDAFSKGALG